MADSKPKHTHVMAVETDGDAPVTVEIGGKGAWWFKVFHAWVETGWWAEVSPAAAKVLIVLAKHANTDWEAWPRPERIMLLAGLERASVFAALRQLTTYGLIERVARGYGHRRDTRWRMLVPARLPAGEKGRKVHGVRGSVKKSKVVDNVTPSPPLSTPLDNVADDPIRQTELSGGLEPALLLRNRSSSEQRIRTTAEVGAGGEQDPAAFVAALGEREALDAKALVLSRQSSDVQHLLAKYPPTSPTLARWIYELFHPAAGARRD